MSSPNISGAGVPFPLVLIPDYLLGLGLCIHDTMIHTYVMYRSKDYIIQIIHEELLYNCLL